MQRLGYLIDERYLGRRCPQPPCPIGPPIAIHRVLDLPPGLGRPSVIADEAIDLRRGARRYELTDWLGNVRVVVSDARVPVQQGGPLRGYRAEVVSVGDYYSYGGRVVERSYEVGRAYRWGFNGQEVVGELGRSHYTARFWEYDGRLGRRWEVDPVVKAAESRYAVFGGNPVRFMDPDGRDTVEIFMSGERRGRYRSHIRAEGRDVFFLVDEGGGRVKALAFERHILEGLKRQSTYYYERGRKVVGSIDIYRIRGDENAQRLFEFLAEATGVEWGWWQVGESGERSLNFLTTTGLRGMEVGGRDLYWGQLRYDYTLRRRVHSYPTADFPSEEDILAARQLLLYQRRRGLSIPKFQIYRVPTRQYREYGGDTKLDQFDELNIVLPDIVISPNTSN